MNNERMLDPELLALPLEDLEERYSELKSQSNAIIPMIDKYEQLENQAYSVEQIISLRRIEKGIASSEDVSNVMLGAVISHELHDGVKLWLSQIATSDKVSVISLGYWNGGSSEYSLVPFSIDVSQGYDNKLIDTVIKISRFLLPERHFAHFGLSFRANDEGLYGIVRMEGEQVLVTISERSIALNRSDFTVDEAIKEMTERYPSVLNARLTANAEYEARLAKKKAEAQSEDTKPKRGFWIFGR